MVKITKNSTMSIYKHISKFHKRDISFFQNQPVFVALPKNKGLHRLFQQKSFHKVVKKSRPKVGMCFPSSNRDYSYHFFNSDIQTASMNIKTFQKGLLIIVPIDLRAPIISTESDSFVWTDEGKLGTAPLHQQLFRSKSLYVSIFFFFLNICLLL